jgi:lipopolysaccharide transport system ATP-binding protein
MSDTVIKVENLFKEYRLGTIGHGTLRHDLASWWANVRGKDDPNSLITKSAPSAPAGHLPALRGEGKKDVEELKQHFLALNDVSFDVKAGEVLGILGASIFNKSVYLLK